MGTQDKWDEFSMVEVVWKRVRRYQSLSLRIGQLCQADPSMVQFQVRSHSNECVWGGVAGNTQSPGDWVREEQKRVQRKFIQEQPFPANIEKWQVLDQGV
jgi:hypothetical protein